MRDIIWRPDYLTKIKMFWRARSRNASPTPKTTAPMSHRIMTRSLRSVRGFAINLFKSIAEESPAQEQGFPA